MSIVCRSGLSGCAVRAVAPVHQSAAAEPDGHVGSSVRANISQTFCVVSCLFSISCLLCPVSSVLCPVCCAPCAVCCVDSHVGTCASVWRRCMTCVVCCMDSHGCVAAFRVLCAGRRRTPSASPLAAASVLSPTMATACRTWSPLRTPRSSMSPGTPAFDYTASDSHQQSLRTPASTHTLPVPSFWRFCGVALLSLVVPLAARSRHRLPTPVASSATCSRRSMR